jgi:hypothetical protein
VEDSRQTSVEPLMPTDSNSHPDRLAKETIGPLFVDFIDRAVQIYRRNRAGS